MRFFAHKLIKTVKPGSSKSKFLTNLLTLLLVSPAVLAPAYADDNGPFGVAVNFFKMGDYRQAVKFLKEAEKTSSYDPRVFYYEGVCYHRTGQLAEARVAYAKVIQMFPDTDAAELAKKGIGVIDFGSGTDRAGGSLARVKNLRVDVVPQTVSLHCLEKAGKPLVDVVIDGKKIPFVLDVTAANSSLGLDIVRANGLNDKPVGSKISMKPLQNVEKYQKVEVKTEKVGKSEVTEKTTTTTEVTHPLSDAQAAEAAAKEQAKDDAKMKTVDVAASDPKAGVDPVESEMVLYDVNLGPIQRPNFPVAVSKTQAKAAVLGKDFLGVYKVTFDITGKTLTMVRDHSYENPFASGLALINKGKYKQAVPLLKRASDNRPSDFRALYCYALALQQSGDTPAARSVYHSCISRFPNTEAQYLATVALMNIDPGFAADARKLQTASSSTAAKSEKAVPFFDVPYTNEGSNIKISVYINNKSTDMLVDWIRADIDLNSAQILQIDPSILQDMQETSRTLDENSGNMQYVTVVKKGLIRSVRLGQAERRNVPIVVTDTGQARAEFAWNGANLLNQQSYRPYIPIKMFPDWTCEVMTNLRVLRFTKH